MANIDGSSLHDQMITALEACRLEVVRRLQQMNLPTSIVVPRLRLIAGDNPGSFNSDFVDTATSAMTETAYMVQIRDPDERRGFLGFREQLGPLAERLAAETKLAARPHGWSYGGGDDADTIRYRYLTNAALQYLRALPSLAIGNPALLERYATELDELIALGDRRVQCVQLAVSGIRTDGPLEHRGVTMRMLTELERGDLSAALLTEAIPPLPPTGGLIRPLTLNVFAPEVLIEVAVEGPGGLTAPDPSFPNQFVLACFLLGYRLSGNGSMVIYDRPNWASFGSPHLPIPIGQYMLGTHSDIDETGFREIVNLAHRIPEFKSSEGSSREIVLYRMLRALGSWPPGAGFLDFATALEAILLSGSRSELSYRFSLYGALFLRDERDPKDTYDRLRNVYEVRSRLVHGSAVDPGDRHNAEADAAQIARSIVLKAITDGWPDRPTLDSQALGSGIARA